MDADTITTGTMDNDAITTGEMDNVAVAETLATFKTKIVELEAVIVDLRKENAELRKENAELRNESYSRVAGILWKQNRIRVPSKKETCPICIDEDVNCETTKCGHSFHDTCLGKLVMSTKSSVHCPTCRARIV